MECKEHLLPPGKIYDVSICHTILNKMATLTHTMCGATRWCYGTVFDLASTGSAAALFCVIHIGPVFLYIYQRF